MLKKLDPAIIKVVSFIAIFSMILLSVSIFVGVISRNIFSYSIPEIEVIRKFAIMWIVFMGSALAVKDNLHLTIDIFSDYLDKRKMRVKSKIVYFLMLISIIILIFVGYSALISGLNRTELVAIRFLKSPPSLAYYYSAFFVGSVFMLYYHLKNGKKLFVKAHNEVNKK